MPSNQFVDDDRFDGLYLNVAQTAHGIEPLLDTVFSFLRRKTDFFSGPPGSENGTEDAIQKVNEVLQKHAQLYQKENEKKKPTKPKTPPKKVHCYAMMVWYLVPSGPTICLPNAFPYKWIVLGWTLPLS